MDRQRSTEAAIALLARRLRRSSTSGGQSLPFSWSEGTDGQYADLGTGFANTRASPGYVPMPVDGAPSSVAFVENAFEQTAPCEIAFVAALSPSEFEAPTTIATATLDGLSGSIAWTPAEGVDQTLPAGTPVTVKVVDVNDWSGVALHVRVE